MDASDIHHRLARKGLMFVVSGQTTVASQPAKGTFYYPTSRQDLKSFGVRWTADHFQSPAAVLFHPNADIFVSAICPNYNPNVTYVEPTPANATDAEALKILRAVLPSQSEWAVDLPKRCLIPKKIGLCYGAGAQPINYIGDGNTQCATPSACATPHYVSICKKR